MRPDVCVYPDKPWRAICLIAFVSCYVDLVLKVHFSDSFLFVCSDQVRVILSEPRRTYRVPKRLHIVWQTAKC